MSKRTRNPEVVVITGASAGAGRCVAREFARHGARIGLIARGREGLEAAKREVEELGGDAIVLVADVADSRAVEGAAQQTEDAFGPIDIWINNAMASVFSPVKEMEVEEYHRVTDVTYLGAVHGTLASLKRMLPRDHGAIVQVGSALAYRSIPLQSAYCAAKHALAGFTDSLRSELIHDKSSVHLTMVHLPALNTPQFGWVKSRLPRKAQPVPPIFQPEVAAKAIYFAAHARRRELLVGLPTVMAIEGNKIAAGYGDYYLGKTGYDSQQRDEPADPNHANNLWQPVPGDAGAHGTFDSRAKPYSIQLWITMNRNLLLGITGAALAGIATGMIKNVAKKQPKAEDQLAA